MSSAAAAFDRLAATYDEQWTHAPVGRAQRDAVWHMLGPFLRPGMHVLDLGCGTGEDAIRMMARGIHVDAIDASSEMVRVACAKGVAAQVRLIEDLGQVTARYDAVLSNFAALNCVADLHQLSTHLTNLVRPGGFAFLCLLNRFCAWETAYYLARGDWRKSVRRLDAKRRASMGVDVLYHSVKDVRSALTPTWSFIASGGIGVATPPSYVSMGPGWVERCAAFDLWAGTTWAGERMADHRLLVLRRNPQ